MEFNPIQSINSKGRLLFAFLSVYTYPQLSIPGFAYIK
nr:MAG TPA: hypothetical protein [Caudoviricetes sp.]